jgi:hypothetical protein
MGQALSGGLPNLDELDKARDVESKLLDSGEDSVDNAA